MTHLKKQICVTRLHGELTLPRLLPLPPVEGTRSGHKDVESFEHGGDDLSDDHACCVVHATVPGGIHLEA